MVRNEVPLVGAYKTCKAILHALQFREVYTVSHNVGHNSNQFYTRSTDNGFYIELRLCFGCMYVCMYVCMYMFIHQTWIYRNYTVIMKIIIYSVKISSPIGTINNSKVVDSAIIVKLGKYKIICRYDSTYGCRL